MLADSLATTENYTVQVRQRGQLTIPQKVRESLGLDDGEMLTLVQVGDLIILTPKQLRVAALADHIASLLEEKDITLADLLEDLPRIREEIYRERYAANQAK
jgi:AbrB family looped-hinge helix DNA binding protein